MSLSVHWQAPRKANSSFQAWLPECKRQREEDLQCLTPVALIRIRRRLRSRGDLASVLSREQFLSLALRSRLQSSTTLEKVRRLPKGSQTVKSRVPQGVAST